MKCTNMQCPHYRQEKKDQHEQFGPIIKHKKGGCKFNYCKMNQGRKFK